MNRLENVLFKNRKYLQKILIFSLIGLFLGYLLYHKMPNEALLRELASIKDILVNKHINFLVIHFIIASILIMASIVGIGIILLPLYFIFEVTCISYNIFCFISVFKFRGFIFSIFFNLITKGLYLLLILIISKKLISILKLFLMSLKNANITLYSLKKHLKIIVLGLILIIINDIFIFTFGSKILLKLSFLIKSP